MGHAIEKATGYSAVLHGEAVALGMAYALELSCAVRGFPEGDARRAIRLLARFGLPVEPSRDWDWGVLRAAMDVDKKAAGGQARFVLSPRAGQSELPVPVPEPELEKAWERWCAHGLGQ